MGWGRACCASRTACFYGFGLWNRARATGAELLWRTKSNHRLPVGRRLSDGSYLSELLASSDRRREDPVTVRVIEYGIDDPGRAQTEKRYRLL